MPEFFSIAPMGEDPFEHLLSMSESDVADLILDVGDELRLQLDLEALRQTPGYKSPMVRYLEVRYSPPPMFARFRPYPWTYSFTYEEYERRELEREQRLEQRRIDEMDPYDYQLELDCSIMYEIDKILGIEHELPPIKVMKLKLQMGWI
jgi:hypothetical protein